MFILSVDLNCDALPQSLSANGIFFLGAVCTLEGENITEPSTASEFEQLYETLSKPKEITRGELTAKNYEDYFDTLLEKNKGAILHICGSERGYERAKKGASVTALKFPKREIYLLKSNARSAGVRLLLGDAVKMRANGLDASEVFVLLSESAENVKTSVVVSSTDWLIKNGYSVSAQPGTMLASRSVFDFSKEKPLLFRSKGAISTAERLVKLICNENKSLSTVFISAGSDEIGGLMYDKLTKKGFKVDFSSMGVASTTEFGPSATVVAYKISSEI